MLYSECKQDLYSAGYTEDIAEEAIDKAIHEAFTALGEDVLISFYNEKIVPEKNSSPICEMDEFSKRLEGRDAYDIVKSATLGKFNYKDAYFMEIESSIVSSNSPLDDGWITEKMLIDGIKNYDIELGDTDFEEFVEEAVGDLITMISATYRND